MAKPSSTTDDKPSRTGSRTHNGRRRSDGHDELVLDEGENGTTVVHEEVVAKIAGTAARAVPGVHALAPQGAGESLASIVGRGRKDLGVRVEIGTTECAVDVRIVAEYGASIPEIARQIRENVNTSVETMTGLIVKEVNVNVTDLYFEEPRPEPAAAPEPTRPGRQLR